MTKGWTEERRQKARERILKNKPWENATGPKTAEGKQRSALNALKHGHRSRLLQKHFAGILSTNKVVVAQCLHIHSIQSLEVKFALALLEKHQKKTPKELIKKGENSMV